MISYYEFVVFFCFIFFFHFCFFYQTRCRPECRPSSQHRRVERAERTLHQQRATETGQRNGTQDLPAVCWVHQDQPSDLTQVLKHQTFDWRPSALSVRFSLVCCIDVFFSTNDCEFIDLKFRKFTFSFDFFFQFKILTSTCSSNSGESGSKEGQRKNLCQ